LFLTTYIAFGQVIKLFNLVLQAKTVYEVKYDIVFYILAILAAVCLCLFYALPDFKDSVAMLGITNIVLPFFFAFVLYLVSLFDERKILAGVTLGLSETAVFMLICPDALPYANLIHPILSLSLLGVLLALSVYAMMLLSTLPFVFYTFLSGALLGLILMFYGGGLPYMTALLATAFISLFLFLTQMSAAGKPVFIRRGGYIALSFLFLVVFASISINELCAPSFVTLIGFAWCEMVLAFVVKYIIKRSSQTLDTQTICALVYEKGLPETAIMSAVFKILALDILLSLFELYAPNALTLPLLSLIMNVWLLTKLYHFDETSPTIKQANRELVEGIKSELKKVKKNFKS